ncbi:MAG: L-seryl-tRNA(Sec) selenium transferase [Firmicutes bacterium]|nr:L-seryl-tRNA(Sec) selenium transferase [Bacillota bacterium]
MIDRQTIFRRLPSVDKVISHPDACELFDVFPRKDVVDSVREAIDEERKKLSGSEGTAESEDLIKSVLSGAFLIAERKNSPSLRRVINATGIMIHTNLGRAVLPEEAIEHAVKAAGSYTNLEFDLEKGERGDRMFHIRKILSELTGAESALAVNNNAAAVLLVFDTFARGREVIASRGELIEIGGSFRLPDIIAKSGAKLVEVGCTNKTHPYDYERAITPDTAILLKSHTSNYVIRGFTGEVSGAGLAELGQKHNIMSVEDMGSGLFMDLSRYGLSGEPTCRDLVQQGLDLITFSGDKLLGGPQCGIILGKSELIDKLAKNPLTRALRLDKMTIAALEGTLLLYRDPDKLEQNIPFLKMLAQTKEEIMDRSENFCLKLEAYTKSPFRWEIREDFSLTGGGAFADTGIPTCVIAIKSEKVSSGEMYKKLLSAEIPLIGRVAGDSFIMDLRTVLPGEEEDAARIASDALTDNV